MSSASKPSWQQLTALVSLSASGVVTGMSFVPKTADLTSPAHMNLNLLALQQTARPSSASNATLRSAIVNVSHYYLRLAQTRTPAEMEALIWRHDSMDGADHGESCAAFASLMLELAAQTVGQQSWVRGGTSYPWPLHDWADVRVDPNAASPGIISVLQDARAQQRWHPLGDGYRVQPGDWALFHNHVEVVTDYSSGVLATIGGDSLPDFSVNAHEYHGSLTAAGVAGFVDNGSLPAAGTSAAGGSGGGAAGIGGGGTGGGTGAAGGAGTGGASSAGTHGGALETEAMVPGLPSAAQLSRVAKAAASPQHAGAAGGEHARQTSPPAQAEPSEPSTGHHPHQADHTSHRAGPVATSHVGSGSRANSGNHAHGGEHTNGASRGGSDGQPSVATGAGSASGVRAGSAPRSPARTRAVDVSSVAAKNSADVPGTTGIPGIGSGAGQAAQAPGSGTGGTDGSGFGGGESGGTGRRASTVPHRDPAQPDVPGATLTSVRESASSKPGSAAIPGLAGRARQQSGQHGAASGSRSGSDSGSSSSGGTDSGGAGSAPSGSGGSGSGGASKGGSSSAGSSGGGAAQGGTGTGGGEATGGSQSGGSSSLPASQQAFIDAVTPGAIATQSEYGVPAPVTIAQAIEESAWGQSKLAANDNNLFGIKGTGPAGSHTMPTQEYEHGQLVTVMAPFRVYHDIAESISDHGALIATSGYYGRAMSVRDDPDSFANALTGVYSTDAGYGAKLIAIMHTFGLYHYGAGIAVAPAAPAAGTGSTATASTGSTGSTGSTAATGTTASATSSRSTAAASRHGASRGSASRPAAHSARSARHGAGRARAARSTRSGQVRGDAAIPGLDGSAQSPSAQPPPAQSSSTEASSAQGSSAQHSSAPGSPAPGSSARASSAQPSSTQPPSVQTTSAQPLTGQSALSASGPAQEDDAARPNSSPSRPARDNAGRSNSSASQPAWDDSGRPNSSLSSVTPTDSQPRARQPRVSQASSRRLGPAARGASEVNPARPGAEHRDATAQPRTARYQTEESQAELSQSGLSQSELSQTELPQSGPGQSGRSQPKWPQVELPTNERPQAVRTPAERPQAERPQAVRPQAQRPATRARGRAPSVPELRTESYARVPQTRSATLTVAAKRVPEWATRAEQRTKSRRGQVRAPVYRPVFPTPVAATLDTYATPALRQDEHLYRNVASDVDLPWEILAACDWMQCQARPRYSPVNGERLGTVNPDGTVYRTRSAALAQCAEDLVELADVVYQIDLSAPDLLSVRDLAEVFAAFRWGQLLRVHRTSAMEFPYSVAGLTARHLHMRWPAIDEPRCPDRPGTKFRPQLGAIPVVLSLDYPATV